MKHIIGIDFGTSTSMIKTAIRNGNADSLETKPVTFTQQGIGATPTLIRKLGDTVWYGFEAEQNERLDAPLIRNFKLGLRSENPEEQRQAAAYVQEFYAYLYAQYQEQKSFLFGMEPGEEETWVSYPVQWSEEQRNVVLDAARTAGFPNVHGLDEPTAAVICILKAKQTELEAAGLLRQGKPLQAMVLDMGAGTTDLAFITVTVDANGLHTNLRGIWPEAGSQYIYGGSQMDARLEELLKKWVESCGFPPDKANNMVVGQRSAIKRWKENTVSPLLANGQTVSDYAGLSATLNMMGQMMGLPVQPFPGLSNERFFAEFAPELTSFVEVISSAPQKLRDETELVILTGGNSEWFWVRDVLLGKESRYGDVGLKEIQDSKNVIRMGQPAETVSRGLVYDRSVITIREAAAEEKPVIAPEKAQHTHEGAFASESRGVLQGPSIETSGQDQASTRAVLQEGKCGQRAFWRLYDDGELIIYGSGYMDDFYREYVSDTRTIFDRLLGKPDTSHTRSNVPWEENSMKVKSIILENGINSLGKYASGGCYNIKTIQLPDSVIEIKENSLDCFSDPIEKLVIPQNVARIGGGINATSIIFTGNMPIMEKKIIFRPYKDRSRKFIYFPSGDKTWDLNKLDWTDENAIWIEYDKLEDIRVPSAEVFEGNKIVVPPNIRRIDGPYLYPGDIIFTENMPVMRNCIVNFSNGNERSIILYPSDDKTWELDKLTWADERINWIGYDKGESELSPHLLLMNLKSQLNDTELKRKNDLIKCDFKMLVDHVNGRDIFGTVLSGELEEGEYVIVKGDDRILRMKVFAIYRDNETEECKVATPGMKAKLTVDDNRNLSKGTILNKLTLTDEERGKVIASGDCGEFGDNVKWKFMGDGTLNIYGNGLMKSWYSNERAQWNVLRNKIYSIHVSEGVETIGTQAFVDSGVRNVELPKSLMRIGGSAFKNCMNLSRILIPKNVVDIEFSFDGSGLREISFAGNMPNMGGTFIDIKHPVTVHYPKNNATWSEGNRKDFGARQTVWEENEA